MLDKLKSHKIVILLFVVIGLFYGVFAFDLNRSDFIKLISLYGALFFLTYKIIQLNKGRFWFLAGIGIFFRFIFIGALPNLSQDFYRFIWDGRLVFQGINPYLFTPEEFINYISTTVHETNGLGVNQTQELYVGMGALNGSHYSNYPPINQLFFNITALFAGKSIMGSVIIMRIFTILTDIGILYYGRKLLEKLGQDPHKIFWYFLNPFIIIEMTGNLHFESVMLFFLIWSLYLLQKQKWVWAAVILGVSVSVKLIPLLFLPLFYKWFMSVKSVLPVPQFLPANKFTLSTLFRFYLIIIGTVIFTFLPLYAPQFASNYVETIGLWFQKFEFNASVYYIIRWIGFKVVGWNVIEIVGKILPLIVLAFILLLTFLKKSKSTEQLITNMLFGISFYYLLSTTVHPWYIATPLLLSVFTKYKFPIVWSLVVMLSYSAYGIDGFSENLWLVALEYLIVIGYAAWEFLPDNKKVFYSPSRKSTTY